ncbi:hypothetical protein DY000_02048546 [Brassica cretica]|uniref:Uncharacterized protein n=1 Tax=Brassica cretica TaxID=69181 RepID=A0ABQ7EMW1_BRACR|nr:hypothetical protein DY000_02048546 [Brassica cretica]
MASHKLAHLLIHPSPPLLTLTPLPRNRANEQRASIDILLYSLPKLSCLLGVILIRIGINGLKPMYGSAIPLIMVQFNGQYHTLIGMIYEVLDREKRRTVGTALKRLEQRGFNQLSLTGAMETIHLVQICMENKENMSGSFWVGLYLDLGEIRLFRSKKRVAARILIHLLSSWPNKTWRI